MRYILLLSLLFIAVIAECDTITRKERVIDMTHDTTLSKIDVDSFERISHTDFDLLVDSCVLLLQSRQVPDIPDAWHIRIMKCLNTVFMKQMKGERYVRLERISQEVHYDRLLIQQYPDWIPSRGLGFYFPSLQMELYGTPHLFAMFNVIDP